MNSSIKHGKQGPSWSGNYLYFLSAPKLQYFSHPQFCTDNGLPFPSAHRFSLWKIVTFISCQSDTHSAQLFFLCGFNSFSFFMVLYGKHLMGVCINVFTFQNYIRLPHLIGLDDLGGSVRLRSICSLELAKGSLLTYLPPVQKNTVKVCSR